MLLLDEPTRGLDHDAKPGPARRAARPRRRRARGAAVDARRGVRRRGGRPGAGAGRGRAW
nr:hypothetical protein [Angustibacter aerolatus]